MNPSFKMSIKAREKLVVTYYSDEPDRFNYGNFLFKVKR